MMAEVPLTSKEREALGEYIIRQRNKGRGELPFEEIKVAIEAIKAAFEIGAD